MPGRKAWCSRSIRSGALIGCTGYRAFGPDHAELGYWIGKPYWGMGYATEAVRALILHAFETDGFAYLTAGHFSDNPASERIIAKFGFTPQTSIERDSAARGEKARCQTYRLDRAVALAGHDPDLSGRWEPGRGAR